MLFKVLFSLENNFNVPGGRSIGVFSPLGSFVGIPLFRGGIFTQFNTVTDVIHDGNEQKILL